MGKLGDWAFTQSDYIRIKPDETVYCKYISSELVQSRFDPEETMVRYKLEVNGSEKTFDSRSINLARIFDEIEEGSWVKITRTGEGPKTRYEVEEVEMPGEPPKKTKKKNKGEEESG